MSNYLVTELIGNGTYITIDRADCGGLMSDTMAIEFTKLIQGASMNSKYIVVRSSGSDFCLGRDSAGRESGRPSDALDAKRRSEVIFNFYGALRHSKIPIISLTQGRALGFGCAMASVCDITISEESASFALPETGHNIMPTMAMSSLIDRVGRKGILYLTYSNEEIDATTALAFGLVSKVVPDGKLDHHLNLLCKALDKTPMPAILGVKEYTANAMSMTIEQATQFAQNMHATINTSKGMMGN
ncbi:MAG: enoyl-CoA hydratase/isomerase family protein [Rhodospirillales bacterium]|tara:strand:- start:30110 stop:30841 length:732 start_codon:yes stop_codon:yes gene_type:complete